jgi:hypothetical protein
MNIVPPVPQDATSDQIIMIVFARMVAFCLCAVILSLCVLIIRDGSSALIADVTGKLTDMVITAIGGLVIAYGVHLKLGGNNNG